jgi:uncharacterized membrane protein
VKRDVLTVLGVMAAGYVTGLLVTAAILRYVFGG